MNDYVPGLSPQGGDREAELYLEEELHKISTAITNLREAVFGTDDTTAVMPLTADDVNRLIRELVTKGFVDGLNPEADSVTNQRNNSAMKFWFGTKAQYDAIANKDANTRYEWTE